MTTASLQGPELERRLTAWLQTQLPAVRELAIDGLGSVEFGHSAEMLVFSATWQDEGQAHRQDLVGELGGRATAAQLGPNRGLTALSRRRRP